jgi:hypothetical protein
MGTTRTRRRRLHELETRFQKNCEDNGRILREIRDDDLWKEAGCTCWDDYLKVRVEEEFGVRERTARDLILACELADRWRQLGLGNRRRSADCGPKYSQSVWLALAPLAPRKNEPGSPRDLAKIDRKKAAVVAREFKKLERSGQKVTAAKARSIVNEVLDAEEDTATPAAARATGELNRILQGDVFERLQELPPRSADIVVTSVPFYRLRRYGEDDDPPRLRAKELGNEETPDQFVGNVVK